MTWAVADQAVAIAPLLSPGLGGVMVRRAVKYPARSVGSGASRLWRLSALGGFDDASIPAQGIPRGPARGGVCFGGDGCAAAGVGGERGHRKLRHPGHLRADGP